MPSSSTVVEDEMAPNSTGDMPMFTSVAGRCVTSGWKHTICKHEQLRHNNNIPPGRCGSCG